MDEMFRLDIEVPEDSVLFAIGKDNAEAIGRIGLGRVR